MNPRDFIIWLNGLFAMHDTLSATDVMDIKKKLREVQSDEPKKLDILNYPPGVRMWQGTVEQTPIITDNVPLAKSGSMHWAPGAVYENPNLQWPVDEHGDPTYGMGV